MSRHNKECLDRFSKNSSNDDKYRENIELLSKVDKDTGNTIDKFLDKTTSKVNDLLITSNKLMELHIALSRCCDWLNGLIEKNLKAAEDAKYEYDDNIDLDIFRRLEDGQELSNKLQNRLHDISNILQNENLTAFYDSIDAAKDIIHQSINLLPEFHLDVDSAKDFEKRTVEHEAKKQSKSQKRIKTPIENDEIIKSTMEKYQVVASDVGSHLKSRGYEEKSSTKRSKIESLNNIDTDDETNKVMDNSGKKMRLLDQEDNKNKSADDEYEFTDYIQESNNNNNNYSDDEVFDENRYAMSSKKTHINDNDNSNDILIDLT